MFRIRGTCCATPQAATLNGPGERPGGQGPQPSVRAARLNILFIGDVFGQPGREALLRWLPGFRDERAVDFVIANGENAANGAGITSKIALKLLHSGVDVLTTGNHVWRQKVPEGSVVIPGNGRAHRAPGQLPRRLSRPRGHRAPGRRRRRSRGDGPVTHHAESIRRRKAPIW